MHDAAAPPAVPIRPAPSDTTVAQDSGHTILKQQATGSQQFPDWTQQLFCQSLGDRPDRQAGRYAFGKPVGMLSKWISKHLRSLA
jgi:hypothetical protein